jgi:hypothetical protein
VEEALGHEGDLAEQGLVTGGDLAQQEAEVAEPRAGVLDQVSEGAGDGGGGETGRGA